MANINTSQKKEIAKVIYLQENATQKDIALRVGVTEKTLGKWIADNKWNELKTSLIATKTNELRRLYMQLKELNDHIFARPEGQRFATGKEPNDLIQITSAIRKLETETGISTVVDVATKVLAFIRKDDLVIAQQLSAYFDAYIKSIV
jgi:DNA-binding XRE family transcriptional regulator